MCDDAASIPWKEAITIGKERLIKMHDLVFFISQKSKKVTSYVEKINNHELDNEEVSYLCFSYRLKQGLDDKKTLYNSLWQSADFDPKGGLSEIIKKSSSTRA